jgi:hypothetical protein
LNQAIDQFLAMDDMLIKKNVLKAKIELEWENERKVIEQLYKAII